MTSRTLARLPLAAAIALALAVLSPAAAASARAAAVSAAPAANAAIGFRLFPASSAWNADVSTLPVDPRSATYLTSIGLDTGLHPDFGTTWDGAPNGIQYVVVHGTQPKVPISFYYGDESDPGPYPIPANAPIEGGPTSTGDRHILVVDVDNRLLYEVYDAHYDPAHALWSAGSGAVWDLNANCVRPDGWTSADAAGLPMLPGLVRYDEVASGTITHALRFTVDATQRAYIWPASHFASDDTNPDLPPMGLRVRLKAAFDISGYPAPVRVILTALKKYGMIVADNGSSWYVNGAPDPRWSDDALHAISQVTGNDFEVVDATGLEPAAPLVYPGRGTSQRTTSWFRRWGCFADPRGSAWTATVDYGDGFGTHRLALTSDKRFRLSNHFVRPRVYRVVITVRDARGAASVSRLRILGVAR